MMEFNKIALSIEQGIAALRLTVPDHERSL